MPGSFFRLCAALSKVLGKRVRPFLSGLRLGYLEWYQWLPELTALYAMRAFVDVYSEHCADASCPGCPPDGDEAPTVLLAAERATHSHVASPEYVEIARLCT